MVRVIPKKHNVNIELLNGFSLMDLLVAFIGFIIAVFVLMADIPFKIYIAGIVACFFIMALVDLDGEKGYQILYYVAKYFISPKVFVRKDTVKNVKPELAPKTAKNEKGKKANKDKNKKETKIYYIDDILDIVDLKDNKIIYKDGQQAYVVRITPMFFDNLSEATKIV